MVGFLSGRRMAVKKRHMYARYIVAYFQHMPDGNDRGQAILKDFTQLKEKL